jgi:formate hydrogenlyase subunit 3/multisubunit Na+/H+ antiporter MnhD subunit
VDAVTPLIPTGVGGLGFALDEVAVPYLFLFALLWVTAGFYTLVTTSRGTRGRVFAYYLPSALGGIAVAAAADAVSFYLCFALMALPAWGLITASGTPEARRAGAIYLTLTAIGEALLLAALVMLATEAGSVRLDALAAAFGAAQHRDLIALLLLASIGLKIGTLPASGILPLSYTYTAAGPAAALAGASVKVGALAMIRLLPAGVMPEGWAHAVMLLGLATAFVAAVLGVLAASPRAVLGYSSASQMGLVLIAAGVSLAEPSAVVLAHGAIVAFSLHHGLSKAALVLGDDIVSRFAGRARTVALAALVVPALALTGAPFTSGFVAKYALKDAVHALHGPVPEAVYTLLAWTAVGTAALMLRFLTLVVARPQAKRSSGPAPAVLWGILLLAGALAVWLWPAEWNAHAAESVLSVSSAWTATWPVVVAIAGALALRAVPALRTRLTGSVVPGDVLVGAATLVQTADRAIGTRRAPAPPDTTRRAAGIGRALTATEGRVVAWMFAATVFVVLALAFAAIVTR